MRRDDPDIIDDDEYDYDPDEEDYSDMFTDDDDCEEEKKPAKSPPVKRQQKSTVNKKKKTPVNTYGQWLIAVILSCIPAVNLIWLIAKGFGKDKTEMKQWARAVLTLDVIACLITGGVFYVTGIKPGSLSAGNITKMMGQMGRKDKSTGGEGQNRNDGGKTAASTDDTGSASKTVTAKFTGGAAVQMTSSDTAYVMNTPSEDDGTQSAQSRMFMSEKGDRSVIVVCIHDSESMKSTISEEYAKDSLSKDEKMSGYESMENSDFLMCSYVIKDRSGRKTYRYCFYGRKKDYITVTADEKLAIAAGYLN